jgi:hypothetical protein
MATVDSSDFSRRSFIKTTGLLTATSAAGMLPGSVLSQVLQTEKFTFGFWNGGRFMPAEQLVTGDTSLESIQVTFQGYGQGGSLKAILGNAFVPVDDGVRQLSFPAWVAPPAGCARTQFVTTVNRKTGLVLSVKQGTVQNIRLGGGSGLFPKLREGTYILAGGSADLSLLTFASKELDAPVIAYGRSGAPQQYVLITIARQ